MASSSSTVIDSISTVHDDIIESHILTRLDGPTLASVSSTSSHFHDLASNEILWSKICSSTWPSVSRTILSNGSRSFFSDAYSVFEDTAAGSVSDLDRPFPELISAVDIHYRGKLVLSKVVKTETTTSWFQSSPLRIELVDKKDTVATPIKRGRRTEDTCRDLENDLTLSWLVIDPVGKRVANLSSHRPVSVQRNWLSGEVEAKFATVVESSTSQEETVECVITVVTCGEEKMQVKEVSFKVEKMEGTHLNGKDSLVILRKVMEGKRRNGRRREMESKRRHEEFMEKKRERKEKKMRVELIFDILTVGFGILGFGSLVGFYLWSR